MKLVRAAAVVLVVVAAGAVSACDSASGPQYNAIGLPCGADKDCAGLYCVDIGGGTCQTPCGAGGDTSASCGAGTLCEKRKRYGSSADTVAVCVPCSSMGSHSCARDSGAGGTANARDGGTGGATSDRDGAAAGTTSDH